MPTRARPERRDPSDRFQMTRVSSEAVGQATENTSAIRRFVNSGLLEEIRPAGVLLGNLRYRQGPANSERGIIIANAAGQFRRVWRRDQVVHLDIIAQRLKS